MKKRKILLTLLGSAFIFTANHAQNINTCAGNGIQGYSGDGGPATAAEFYNPHAIIADALGNVYVADYYNNVVRKINSSGTITTFAGNGTAGFSGDGAQASNAELHYPLGLAVDGSGNVYIADELNDCIRKVNSSGVITTVAGTHVGGYSGDGGQATAAKINWPAGIAIDATGDIFIADYANNRIRKVNASGIITTLAGTGTAGFTGDGGLAIAAEINTPHGITLDASGNIYFGDSGNDRVRFINAAGIINTAAGNGTAGPNGDGGQATAAELDLPVGVAFDATGNLFISDYQNQRIRRVDPSGVITTWAGDGTAGFSGDGGPATAAELNYPYGVAFNPVSKAVYIADNGNNRIRTFQSLDGVNDLQINNAGIALYPNPTTGKFTVQINNKEYIDGSVLQVYNLLGEEVHKGTINATTTEVNLNNAAKGIYICRIIAKQGNVIETLKLVIE